MSMFQKATKRAAKLRLAVMGPSGSGKTYTSLAIAAGLGDTVALVDTESGSASKYADLFNFDVAEMHAPFSVGKYLDALRAAQEAGYATVILDSVTHAWQGTGGILDYVDEVAKRSKSQNTFAAWKEGTPLYNQLVNAIVQSDIHVIVTMRSKTEYVIEATGNGKSAPRKIGMAPIQRDGFEYEFDVVLDMDADNNAIVTKSRCPALTSRVFPKPGADVAAILSEWLSGEPATTDGKHPWMDEQTERDTPAASENGSVQSPPPNGKALDAGKDYRGGLLAELNQTFPVADRDAARHWLIRSFTTRITPNNVRESSNDLTPAECKQLADAVRENRAEYQRLWGKQAQTA